MNPLAAEVAGCVSQVHPQAWRRCDLHMHTRFSGWRSLRALEAQDSYVDPVEAYDTARARGMDFVCFSDHDTIQGAIDFLARRPEEEPRVIVAEEVEARFPGRRDWIHIQVFDVDERLHDDLVRLRANGLELIEELRRREVLFALNHPFQSFRSLRSARRLLPDLLARFPAIEVLNSTSPRSHRGVLELLLAAPPLAGALAVGGSDAHTLRRIAAAYTAAPGADRREYLDNVRRGNSRIGGEASGTLALTADVYSIVMTYYTRLLASVGQRSRSGGSLALAGLLLPAVLLGVPALLTALQQWRQEWIARGYAAGRLRAEWAAESADAWSQG